MSLKNISAQIAGHKNKIPPVELWDPPYCGEIDMQIKADGQWLYGGTIFKRQSLVRLFASVLKKEEDEYFLVTPVEKVKITVDEVPFVLTQWHWVDEQQTSMMVSTNVEDEFILNAEHPLTISEDGSLYVTVRRNLVAKVHRNVFYQWIDFAKKQKNEQGTELVFFSDAHQFSLGFID